jgi:glycosyltransferase involved in cell wall biosynthesis
MKICLIIDDYLPDSIKVGAKMMHELACEYVSQGHQVTVITPSSRISKNVEIGLLDGVTVIRFKNGEIKNVNKIKRAINETLLSYNAWRLLKSHLIDNKHDLIVYYSPSIFWGGLVDRLKSIWQVPSYLILRDLFPQWAIDQGIINPNSLIEKYFRYFESINYQAADTIGLMSEKNLVWFDDNFKSKANLEVLYNWASLEPVRLEKDYKQILHIEDKIVYFYGGNIGHAQDMMNIVRLAKAMQHIPKAYFVLVGAGDEVDLVKNAIKNENLTNIRLLPSVDQQEFKQMLVSFDIGLFTLHKEHTTHNFPGKLLGYMVQSMPILGSINQGNDLKEIIENANAGLISINGNDKLFYEHAMKLLDDRYREEIGDNAFRLLSDKFSVNSASKQILQTICLEE